MTNKEKAKRYLARIRNGENSLLAKCITRLESPKREDIDFSRVLIEESIDPPNTAPNIAMRIAITGIPGAGKSTFIERFCLHLHKEKPQRIAILTIDPSSALTGGSILGDRIRMENIANHPDIFVRTSPSRDFLGGIGEATRESLILCEAGGYHTIILETVGTGQSEKAATSMVDFVMLLLTPAGGDDLQGIKRGILEHTDLIVVNKADGVLESLADSTAHFYQQAAEMGVPHKEKSVMTCSAKEDRGLREIFLHTQKSWKSMKKTNILEKKRKAQDTQWMKEIYQKTIWHQLSSHLETKGSFAIKKQLQQGIITPYQAADSLIKQFQSS